MTSEKKKRFLESFREVWLPRRNRNAGPKVSPAGPVVAPESLSALEKDKLVSELERERNMAIAAPSYLSQSNQAYAQSNSLATTGASQMSAYQIYASLMAQGSGQMPNASNASPEVQSGGRIVSIEIDPTTDSGVYSLLVGREGGGYHFHISDAMLKTLHKKWLMARNRAEEDMGDLNNSEEGESDVE